MPKMWIFGVKMEIFYSSDLSSDTVRLDREESGHCVKVLRHKAGDAVSVIDGLGTLLHCTLLEADPREAVLRIDSREEGWGALPYRLTLGVCPTKNADRFEWAVEKATEFGVDCIAPLVGEHSERRVFKSDRARRIALAATKQSLKASIPSIPDPAPVREFLAGAAGSPRDIHLARQCATGSHERATGVEGEAKWAHLPQQPAPECSEMPPGVEGEFHKGPLRLIACCFDGPDWQRVSMREALETAFAPEVPGAVPEITVLVGPEGDFSPEEVEAARAAGFVPVHLGSSRLRTETAAVAAAAFVYCHFM